MIECTDRIWEADQSILAKIITEREEVSSFFIACQKLFKIRLLIELRHQCQVFKREKMLLEMKLLFCLQASDSTFYFLR